MSILKDMIEKAIEKESYLRCLAWDCKNCPLDAKPEEEIKGCIAGELSFNEIQPIYRYLIDNVTDWDDIPTMRAMVLSQLTDAQKEKAGIK